MKNEEKPSKKLLRILLKHCLDREIMTLCLSIMEWSIKFKIILEDELYCRFFKLLLTKDRNRFFSKFDIVIDNLVLLRKELFVKQNNLFEFKVSGGALESEKLVIDNPALPIAILKTYFEAQLRFGKLVGVTAAYERIQRVYDRSNDEYVGVEAQMMYFSTLKAWRAIECIEEVQDEDPERNLHAAYEDVLRTAAYAGDSKGATEALMAMSSKGFAIKHESYARIIVSFACKEDFEGTKQLLRVYFQKFNDFRERELELLRCVSFRNGTEAASLYSCVLSVYKELNDAQGVYKGPSSAFFNRCIKQFGVGGDFYLSFSVVKAMLARRLVPNAETLTNALETYLANSLNPSRWDVKMDILEFAMQQMQRKKLRFSSLLCEAIANLYEGDGLFKESDNWRQLKFLKPYSHHSDDSANEYKVYGRPISLPSDPEELARFENRIQNDAQNTKEILSKRKNFIEYNQRVQLTKSGSRRQISVFEELLQHGGNSKAMDRSTRYRNKRTFNSNKKY